MKHYGLSWCNLDVRTQTCQGRRRLTSHADFYPEGVISPPKTLIQFFQLFSLDLKDNPSVPPGRRSITPPSVVWAGGELNVSTTSLTAGGVRDMVASYCYKNHCWSPNSSPPGIIMWHYNMLMMRRRALAVTSFISLPSPLPPLRPLLLSPCGTANPPVICTLLPICGGVWK